MNPTNKNHVGIHTLLVKFQGSDMRFNTTTVKIKVVDDPPMFKDGYPQNQKVKLNGILNYKIPEFVDKENQEVSVEHIKLPKFCKY